MAPHLVVRVLAGRIAAIDQPERRLLILDEAEEQMKPGEVCGPCSIGLRVNAAMACARAGEVMRARHCLAQAEALAGMWQGGPWRAACWEARAAVRMAEGDENQASALLREAASGFAESGRPLDASRCEEAARQLADLS